MKHTGPGRVSNEDMNWYRALNISLGWKGVSNFQMLWIFVNIYVNDMLKETRKFIRPVP